MSRFLSDTPCRRLRRGASNLFTQTIRKPAILSYFAEFARPGMPGIQRSGLGSIQDMADKRRCVEIALREFPKLSSRAIADMCGVSHDFVSRLRELSLDDSPTRTSKDGKERPATQPKRATEPEPEPIYECDEFEGLDKQPREGVGIQT